MSRRRGLGSGLDALLAPAAAEPSGVVRMIPVNAIQRNRSQPRTHFDEQGLEELAASIRAHGVIQPLIVSEDGAGTYELIAGERRWRAAQRAGLQEVPALLKHATPQQLLELALVENVQRADLNPLEEGLAYQTLKDEFALTDEEIAQRVGKSRVAVVNTRRLIKLVPAARQALLDGQISAGHGRALLRFDQEPEQIQALDLIVRRELNVREAERLADLAQHAQLAPAVRQALLSGTLGTAQAQALLRLNNQAQQQSALHAVLERDLSGRATDHLSDLLVEGSSLAPALERVQGRPPQPAPLDVRSAASAAPIQPVVPAALEHEETVRLFERLLATPVRLVRNGREIRLTITMFEDAQLQALYERLGGSNGHDLVEGRLVE